MKDGQHRHWDTEKNNTEYRARKDCLTTPPWRLDTTSRDYWTAALTWVCGRDDGPKEEAVSEVKISTKLTHSFHEPHKAVHDQPTEIKDVHNRQQRPSVCVCEADYSESKPTRWWSRRSVFPWRRRPGWSQCSWRNVSDTQTNTLFKLLFCFFTSSSFVMNRDVTVDTSFNFLTLFRL